MSIVKAAGLILFVPLMHTQIENATSPHPGNEKFWVYVGTAAYTGTPTNNLYLCNFDAQTGELKLVGLAADTENPGFLAVHPSQRFLYATNELPEFKGHKTGSVSAFRIDSATGKLELLNRVPSFGANPAFISMSRNGKFALVANYYGGTESLPIERDGSLGPPVDEVRERGAGVDPDRQEGSHPHSVLTSPDDRFAIAADLGLDKLFVYKFDENTGSLKQNSPAFVQAPHGSGPRHLAFGPDARYAYVVNELLSTVSTYSFDKRKGVLHLLQSISTLPPRFKGENSGAEVQIGPSGKFVYVSNRGADSIVVFAVNPTDGMLSPAQDVPSLGKTPRNFEFDPSGRFLLVGNQDSDLVVVFRVDQATGRSDFYRLKGEPSCPRMYLICSQKLAIEKPADAEEKQFH